MIIKKIFHFVTLVSITSVRLYSMEKDITTAIALEKIHADFKKLGAKDVESDNDDTGNTPKTSPMSLYVEKPTQAPYKLQNDDINQ